MDALLIGSVDLLACAAEARRRAYNRAFAAAGLDWFWDRERWDAMQPFDGPAQLAAQAQAAGVGLAPRRLERAARRQLAHVMQRDGIVLRPGMADLLAHARGTGLRLGIVARGTGAGVAAAVHGWDVVAGTVVGAAGRLGGTVGCVTGGAGAARAAQAAGCAVIDAGRVAREGAGVLAPGQLAAE